MYINPIFLTEMPENKNGRDFIVGDLHGCFEELTKLMDHVNFNPNEDRLFSTGDLIDRGPKSLDCLALLKKKWFFPILGNHEDIFLIRYKMYEEKNTTGFAREELDFIEEAKKYLPNILKMPLVYSIENQKHGKVYIVHAEILPEHLLNRSKEDINKIEYNRYVETMKSYDFSNQIEKFMTENKDNTIDYYFKQKLIWSRSIVKDFSVDHKEDLEKQNFAFMGKNKFKQKTKVFCGHNIVPFPMKIGQQIYIDTGAALGYIGKTLTTPIFTQFGHKYFTLTMVDINSGTCYACITSPDRRGEIVKSAYPLY